MDEGLQKIREAVKKIALVDGHAHNLVAMDSTIPLLQAFSEGTLESVPHTLCFKRSVKDIAELYGIDPSLELIEEYRRSTGLESVTSKCFEAANINAVLVDDGLSMDKAKILDFLTNYVPLVRKVLRIETVAEDILKQGPPGGVTWTLDSFADRFVSTLNSYSVVAYKSIAAYRSGLDIDPNVSRQDAEAGLMEDMARKTLRLSNKSLIDFLFVLALETASLHDLPVQLHTGFGDRDLDLRLANPLYLRAVLEDSRFSKCRIVLLHASYPYVQEASHLASVYPQVYLDFGLAIPKLSVRGMEVTLSQLLELAPLNKIMFSTDGCAFPETYFLGAKWSRDVLSRVLCNAYLIGDLTVEESIVAAERILHWNATSFYGLSRETTKSSANGHSQVVHFQNSKKQPHHDKKNMKLQICPSIKHVRLLWCDTSMRCRVVPVQRFINVVVEHGVGLAECGMGMPVGMDSPAQGCGLTSVGEIKLIPDLSTKQKLLWHPEHEVVLVDMHVVPGTPWELCPRSTLARMTHILKQEFNLELRAGFENEFYLLKPSSSGTLKWTGVDTGRYCSFGSYDGVADILDNIYEALVAMNIEVEQMHAEAGHGQYEIALTHYPAITAADNVLLLRQTVKCIAKKHNLLATFLPKCFEKDLGSGSHVHVSLWQDGKNEFPGEACYGMSTVATEFIAGVLHHLPALLAFTAPHPNSYSRIQPGTWSGAFQCWGISNREAPLRAVNSSSSSSINNVELKTFDGMANPYLGLAALIAAGIDGLRKHLSLPEPIAVDPATLPNGSVPRLPTSLQESVAALQSDDALQQLLGTSLVHVISAIRRADIELNESEDLHDSLLEMF